MPSTTSQSIQTAVERVTDQESFIQGLLVNALGWPIDAEISDVEDITYDWSADNLRAADLDKKLVDGKILQIRPFPGNPWGIFLLEFNNEAVFTKNRGMTGILRKVLRGLVPSKTKSSNLASFKRENLLFICNHDYKHFRFAHFKNPKNPKRVEPLAAFGWGPGDPIRTLCEFNLNALTWPSDSVDEQDWLSEWSEAFDVEKVTARFYKDYARVFSAAEKEIGKSDRLSGDDLRMFTQTLFNRLMFIRFIERKEWLKFDDGNNYLKDLHAAGGMKKQSLYSSRIRPLFFEGLAIEGKQSSDAYGEVPFLNGGLFEEEELDSKAEDIPDLVFDQIISADGLFYQYNFTVEESTPLEIEVAVDPEMLGKVFEELVTGRHESGSYYTPRPIVSFMCREALKGVLTEKTSASETAIARLVDDHDVGRLSQAKAKEVLQALDSLKAVDPACGSGAYLLGLLHELIAIYAELFNTKLSADAKSLYDLKLDIITKNLYGVDIDPFATNIAKLRLWLSLAVEAEHPVALPNLDFKIETGDSLLAPNPQEAPDLFRMQLQNEANVLALIKNQYLLSHGAEKEKLREQINATEARLKQLLDEHYEDDVIDWRIEFAEVFGFGDRGFDIVLANPPYVRQELITGIKPALRRNFDSVYAGSADLYVYFYARAMELLHKGGMLAFIAPNKFFRAGYGAKLRKHLATMSCVQTVIDFADYPIFQAITYPAIVVTKKGKCGLGNETFSGCNWNPNDRPSEIDSAVSSQKAACSRGLLTQDAWQIIDAGISKLIEKISSGRKTLGDQLNGRLYRGIVTGANAVFEINQKTYDQLVKADAKSQEIILPWLRGRNVGRWDVNWGNQYLIFTRRGIDMKEYPAVLKYLKPHRKRLEPRPDDVPSQGWHGRKPGSYKWYEIQDAIDYWREFDKPKIMYQEIATYQQFAFSTKAFVANNKVFIIPDPPSGLLAVLNSKVVWFFLNQFSAKLQHNALALQSPYMNQIPIATPNVDLIAKEHDMLSIDRRAIEGMEQTRMLEREIDAIVMKMYGLDAKDEQIIDDALAKSDNRFPQSFRDSPEYQQYVAENFE